MTSTETLPIEEGPSKGLDQISLLSSDERLKGRPRLCSDCGFCDSSLKLLMSQTCTFVRNQTRVCMDDRDRRVTRAVSASIAPCTRRAWPVPTPRHNGRAW